MKNKDTKFDDRLYFGKKKKAVLFPVAASASSMPKSYAVFLSDLKKRIQQERLRVVLSSNAALVNLYWDIGQGIIKKQKEEGWGAKVIDRLSVDLRQLFPDMKGFSPRNLKYMRAFAEAWTDKTIVQRVIAQLPWRSNIALLDKLDKADERLWYAQKTIQQGWSQPVLCHQIETQFYQRQGKAINNFSLALPPVDSDMAQQIFKDPYVFDFLGTADSCREAQLEQGLMDHVQKFLVELGAGFAFVGRQVHLINRRLDFF